MIFYTPPTDEEKAYNRLLREFQIVGTILDDIKKELMCSAVFNGFLLGCLVYVLWKG